MLIVAIVILASSASFGLGFLAGRDAGQGVPMQILPEALSHPIGNSSATPATGQVIASKNGTKYYLPDCAGASRISDVNKVWFASASAALAAGYEPAANCKGI